MKKNKFMMWILWFLSICIVITASAGMFYLAKSVWGYITATVLTLDLIYFWRHWVLKKLS